MNFLIFSVIILAIIIVILVLAQPSQEEGLAGLTGQSSVQEGSFFGKDKHTTLSFLTWFCFALFIILSLILTQKSQKFIREKSQDKSFLEKIQKQEQNKVPTKK